MKEKESQNVPQERWQWGMATYGLLIELISGRGLLLCRIFVAPATEIRDTN